MVTGSLAKRVLPFLVCIAFLLAGIVLAVAGEKSNNSRIAKESGAQEGIRRVQTEMPPVSRFRSRP